MYFVISNLVVIDLITTVRPTLRSASVIVMSRNPAALECATAYRVEVEPTVDSQRPPLAVNSSMSIITVHELNFCKSNYTFRITVFDRNNNTYNDVVRGVSGDLNGIIKLAITLHNTPLWIYYFLTYSIEHTHCTISEWFSSSVGSHEIRPS